MKSKTMTQPSGDLVNDYAIDVKNLTKSFGEKTVVDDVSIKVRRGQIYGFLGPNGSGKTTTMRLICGLLTPDAGTGSGTCLDYDIHDSSAIKQHLGYMTQHFSLYGDLTVQENLSFVAGIFDVANPRRKVHETLHQLGLEHRADQRASTLSGGWKQRLALASCLLHDPALLLLDEPTAGVDPQARREFWNHIHALAQGGITVLVSTHYMDEAERCHELAFISKGKILDFGTLDQVIDRSHLTSFVVTGEELDELAIELEGRKGIDIVTRFGNALHVSGPDRQALERSLIPFRDQPGREWQQAEPTLEDVFIQLMGKQT